MRSDVPCAETARLVLAVGFPLPWSVPRLCLARVRGSRGMAAANCSELSRTSEQWFRLNRFLLSNQTEHCKWNRNVFAMTSAACRHCKMETETTNGFSRRERSVLCNVCEEGFPFRAC